jgi:hypothetical protein
VKRLIKFLREQSLANFLVAGFVIVCIYMVAAVATDLMPPLFGSVTLPRRGVRFRIAGDEGTLYPRTTDGLRCRLSIPDQVAFRYLLDKHPNPRYVIDVEETETTDSVCRYETNPTVARVKVDWTARLFDLKTGEMLAEKQFEGYVPYPESCPEWVTIQDPSVEAFYGCPNDEEFADWVLSTVRDRPVGTPTPQPSPHFPVKTATPAP